MIMRVGALMSFFAYLFFFASGCATVSFNRMYVPVSDYISTPNDLQITAIYVGQGDAIFVQTPNGKHILIDAGGIPSWKGSGDTGRKYVIPFLERQLGKDLRLDAVIMTHPHADHVGGMPTVFKEIPVKKVYDPGYSRGDPEYLKCLEIIEEKNIDYEIIRAGSVIDIDPDISIQVFSPPRDFFFEGPNNNSLLIRITYKDFSVLLTGDIESEAERYAVSKYGNLLRSNVLKSPHHGSRSSSTSPFMSKVRPEVVLISCGRNNLFGHPHAETLSRYRKYGAQVYRTDLDGDVTVVSNGFSFAVWTQKKP